MSVQASASKPHHPSCHVNASINTSALKTRLCSNESFDQCQRQFFTQLLQDIERAYDAVKLFWQSLVTRNTAGGLRGIVVVLGAHSTSLLFHRVNLIVIRTMGVRGDEGLECCTIFYFTMSSLCTSCSRYII